MSVAKLTVRYHLLIAGSLLILLLTARCGNEAEQTVSIIARADVGQRSAAQDPGDQAGGAVLALRRAGAFHSFLVDGNGKALYMFTADADADGSVCSGECAEEWPPLLTRGDPVASQPEVDDHLLDTIELDDGRLQVTYGGWPLYYYVGDSEPGEISGHGRESFDGIWYLVTPEGDPIKTNVSSY